SRRLLREAHIRDGRRIAFKSLSDRRQRALLSPLLTVARKMPGLCLVVITNRRLRHLCLHTDEDYEGLRVTASLNAPWKRRELEEAVRTSYMIALLVRGRSQPGQAIGWISDEDNVFANDTYSADMANLLGQFTGREAP